MSLHETPVWYKGNYVAEVSVDLMDAEGGWSPYLTLDDGYRLDDIPDALRRGDIRTASRKARVYKLTPVETQIVRISRRGARLVRGERNRSTAPCSPVDCARN